MKQLIRVFITLCVFSFSVQTFAKPLVDPGPIAIPTELSHNLVVNEIKRAVIGRGWTISKEESAALYATLHIRSHVAKVKINLNEKDIKISYLSSENLNYKVRSNGKPYIHKNYLSWVNNIATDISKNLQLATLE